MPPTYVIHRLDRFIVGMNRTQGICTIATGIRSSLQPNTGFIVLPFLQFRQVCTDIRYTKQLRLQSVLYQNGLISIQTMICRSYSLVLAQRFFKHIKRNWKRECESLGKIAGVLLCQDKVDAMVELTLPEKSDIYTSQYRLYLPEKKLLQKK